MAVLSFPSAYIPAFRPYSEFFWSVFSRIRTEYGEIRSKSPYSVRMRENTDQKNPEYGHFSRSASCYQSLLNFFTQCKLLPITIKFQASRLLHQLILAYRTFSVNRLALAFQGQWYVTFPWIALEERMKITSLAVILKVCITTAFFKKKLEFIFYAYDLDTWYCKETGEEYSNLYSGAAVFQ